MKLFKKIFGDDSTRALNRLKPKVAKVNSYEESIQKLTDTELKEKTNEFKNRLENGETLDDILEEAFAVVREAAKRTLGMRPYDVQLIGGMVLHEGMVAEMRTGEGKTLVATMPAYLNALTGKGVHIVTVNDYLARRDTQWMGQVYQFLGLSVSVINSGGISFMYDPTHKELDEERDEEGSYKVFEEFLRPISRKQAYLADITYGTNNEFGFDYLRDNTQRNKEGLSQRDHSYVIVDEVDSVLIDEARVPLILSTQGEDAEDLYRSLATVARQLHPETDYTTDEKLRAIQLTNEGIEHAEKLLKMDNLYTQENMKMVHHLETAIRAKALYVRDRDYVVKDGNIIIVDPFTGRMQEGRRWSDGLHQAIEAKEGVAIRQESKTMASITYQNYFKFYTKLAGMTGTAVTSQEEFGKVYDLDVVVIPTNRPIARKDHIDFIFQTEKGKFEAVARKVKELHEKGQPVLIGTVSVEKNELLSSFLKQKGVPHNVLNAKNHEQEGIIVAEAGKKGAVTIATNMAGRGVDIKLGGPRATQQETEHIKEIGGLFVLGTERHEARRIDNQLRGRSGRQGDPGETQFYVSLEDPLMKIFGAERVQSMIGALGIKEDEAIQNKFITRQLEKAQERIEGFHFDARKNILEFDDVLSHHRNLIYERRRKILFNDDQYVEQIYNDAANLHPDAKKLIEKNKDDLGEKVFMDVMRQIALHIIDRLWMQHLEVMENARRSVNLRAYGQREPLVEYKKESLRLFKELESTLNDQLAGTLARLDVEAVKKQVREQRQRQEVQQQEQSGGGTPVNLEEIDDNDKILIKKGFETREVKKKKLDTFLETGWEVVKKV